jgi:hypothetical protein
MYDQGCGLGLTRSHCLPVDVCLGETRDLFARQVKNSDIRHNALQSLSVPSLRTLRSLNGFCRQCGSSQVQDLKAPQG